MINLLPPQAKEQIKFGRWNVVLVQYTILILIVTGLLAGLLVFGVQLVSGDESRLEESLAQKQKRFQELSENVQSAQDLSKTIDTIAALLASETRFSQLLPAIGNLIPVGARLTNLSLTGNPEQPLQITADVNSTDTAAVMRANLENSAIFSLADIQSITFNSEKNNFTTTIIVQFTGEEEN